MVSEGDPEHRVDEGRVKDPIVTMEFFVVKVRYGCAPRFSIDGGERRMDSG